MRKWRRCIRDIGKPMNWEFRNFGNSSAACDGDIWIRSNAPMWEAWEYFSNSSTCRRRILIITMIIATIVMVNDNHNTNTLEYIEWLLWWSTALSLSLPTKPSSVGKKIPHWSKKRHPDFFWIGILAPRLGRYNHTYLGGGINQLGFSGKKNGFVHVTLSAVLGLSRI